MEEAEFKMIFIRSDTNGQDQELLHQRDSTGGMVWRENTRGKTEVVWTVARGITPMFLGKQTSCKI